jgi:hypothetical protein
LLGSRQLPAILGSMPEQTRTAVSMLAIGRNDERDDGECAELSCGECPIGCGDKARKERLEGPKRSSPNRCR